MAQDSGGSELKQELKDRYTRVISEISKRQGEGTFPGSHIKDITKLGAERGIPALFDELNGICAKLGWQDTDDFSLDQMFLLGIYLMSLSSQQLQIPSRTLIDITQTFSSLFGQAVNFMQSQREQRCKTDEDLRTLLDKGFFAPPPLGSEVVVGEGVPTTEDGVQGAVHQITFLESTVN